MAKKKNKKLPQIGVLGYLTLDELFDYIFMYINENIESDDDYKKMAEYLSSLGDYENWRLRISSRLPITSKTLIRSRIRN